MRRWWMGPIIVVLLMKSSIVAASPQGDFQKKLADLRESIVKVSFFLKKDTERGDAELMMYPLGYAMGMLIAEKQSLDLSGLVIDSALPAESVQALLEIHRSNRI